MRHTGAALFRIAAAVPDSYIGLTRAAGAAGATGVEHGSQHLHAHQDPAHPPAARRTFGALQRTLATLNGRLRDDETLCREAWLAGALDTEDLALRQRAWAERRPVAKA
jgi:hypothetical protein